MKRIIIFLFALGSLQSCKEFLDMPPQGAASEENLKNADGAEKLVNAAYASLGNDHWFEPYTSLWPYGNIRAGDAYKGGLGVADLVDYHIYETFSAIRTDISGGNRIWGRLYIAVQRTNSAIKVLNELPEGELTTKTQRVAEMRFLRAHFHFILKILFKKIPYIVEDLNSDQIAETSNEQFSNDELWSKIAEDFQFAVDNLPKERTQVGRPNNTVAKAYLAKTKLFQAYQQNDQHEISSINATALEQVVKLADEVINSGEFQLFDDIGKNFLWDFDNGTESVFAVQRSKDDGSPIGRIDMSTALTYPMYPGYGCCSFHRPSQNLINSFQTTDSGIPNFENFNNNNLEKPEDFKTNSVDPRLDHTAGIPTHPYKYQKDVIYSVDKFTREPGTYGPYSSMKDVQKLSCPCLTTAQTFAYPASSKNNVVIRFADVLLWKAEALIELGRHNESLPIINQIRIRAKNSTEMLKNLDGSYIANYKVEPYVSGINISWTKENARKALRWERRLEFALEGSRFFDLVRWGIAESELNTYFEKEKTRVPYLSDAKFKKGRDEYLPIPEQQIQYSKGIYVQNAGW
jgi:hypothetical protein